MNEAKFTKGDWVVINREPQVFDQNPINSSVKMPSSQKTKYGACMYAAIGGFSIETQRVEVEANAHLIAVAPEMYKELSELAEWLEYREDYKVWSKRVNKLLASARGEK